MNIIDKIIKKKTELTYDESNAMDNFMKPIYQMQNDEQREYNKLTGKKNKLYLNKHYNEKDLGRIHKLLKANFYGSKIRKGILEAELSYCIVIINGKIKF